MSAGFRERNNSRFGIGVRALSDLGGGGGEGGGRLLSCPKHLRNSPMRDC